MTTERTPDEGLRAVVKTIELQMDGPYITLINRDAQVILQALAATPSSPTPTAEPFGDIYKTDEHWKDPNYGESVEEPPTPTAGLSRATAKGTAVDVDEDAAWEAMTSDLLYPPDAGLTEDIIARHRPLITAAGRRPETGIDVERLTEDVVIDALMVIPPPKTMAAYVTAVRARLIAALAPDPES